MSREGGTVRVVPEGTCEGLQNRPPGTKSPSKDESALPVQERPPGTKTPSGTA